MAEKITLEAIAAYNKLAANNDKITQVDLSRIEACILENMRKQMPRITMRIATEDYWSRQENKRWVK